MHSVAPRTAVTLAAGALEATFVPGAGMVGASLRHRGEELLGQRDGVAAYAERAATMGIPFLHPWANRLTLPGLPPGLPVDEHGLPIHGVLPRAWRAEPTGATSLRAMLDFPAEAAFPYAHRVEQHIALGRRTLTLVTALTATGAAPVPVSFGFHPYLRLPGVPRPDWIVALPHRRRLLTDDRGIPTGETAVEAAELGALGTRTFDDGYDRLGSRPRFAVAGDGRRIAVELGEGYPVAQVFAPADDDVICFEPMTAPVDALRSGDGLRHVPPGGTFRAAFAVHVDG